MENKPKVTLLTWTRLPLETVYSIWQASKGEEELLTPEQIEACVSPDELGKVFKAIIAQRIPIGEHIDFVFMVENISVSWREQAVRHRIGVGISPERLGIDIVPDLAKSSFWSQSMRIQDMSKFAINKKYRLPESIKNHPNDALERLFHETMRGIGKAYNILVSQGIPMEDARELIPLGAQHRISWKLNMGALQHIIGERGCFILQLGVWGPVIEGMVDELVSKVHPIFRDLVCPPCIKKDEYAGCVYEEECRRRIIGEDRLPPCPLHFYHSSKDIQSSLSEDMVAKMQERSKQYKIFWNRDPYTGHRCKD